MGGGRFDIEDLCALSGQLVQQSGLGGPSAAADEYQAVGQWRLVEGSNDLTAVVLVAPFEKLHAPSDLIEDGGKSTRALPAAPAID